MQKVLFSPQRIKLMLIGASIALVFLPLSGVAAVGDMRFDPANSSGSEGLIQVEDSVGRWAYVCDDIYDGIDEELTVAENYFGEAECVESTVYTQSPIDNFLLDDLACTGTESTWYDCPRRPDYAENCSVGEAFGIACTARLESAPIPSVSILGLGLLAALLAMTGFIRHRMS